MKTKSKFKIKSKKTRLRTNIRTITRRTNTRKNIKLYNPNNKTKRVKNSIFNPLLFKNTKKTKKHSLYPIMNPLFNIREIAKQLILLEDHISHSEKRCPDCILKHTFTIEALLDEAICLDKKMTYCSTLSELNKLYHPIANEIEQIVINKKLINSICCPIAQKLRFLRKPLVKLSAGMLKDY